MKNKRNLYKVLSLVLMVVCALFLVAFSYAPNIHATEYVNDIITHLDNMGSVSPSKVDFNTLPGENTYSLFNSGVNGGYGNYYNYSNNYDEKSYTNGGYDIYSRCNSSNLKYVYLGLGFTVEQEVTERGTLTIYAFDVDE